MKRIYWLSVLTMALMVIALGLGLLRRTFGATNSVQLGLMVAVVSVSAAILSMRER